MATGLIHDKRFQDHDTGPNHPERPERLEAIDRHLNRTDLINRVKLLPFTKADLTWIRKVHTASYIDRLRLACDQGRMFIDVPDSAICPSTFDIALLAVGGVLSAVDHVMREEVHNAFCAVRPPGHHAEFDRSMGFCMFNNIAIAAEYLLNHHGLERVAIVDFDVHHGNGTQHTFEARKDVLFISIHEDPAHLYPGTGYAHETGSGEGKGYTINVPMHPMSGDEAYMAAFEEHILPALIRHKPQALLLSAGFDAAAGDPLAHIMLSMNGFDWITRHLRDVSETHCGGRLISILEGGYDLDSLSEAVGRHLRVLIE